MPRDFLFIKCNRTVQRRRDSGFVLLTTLLGLLVFASLIVSLQRLSSSNSIALARLTDRVEESIGRSSLYEQLRGPIADAMTGQAASGIPFNGVDVTIESAGRNWVFQAQDVESLIDVYLAPSEVIGLVLPNPRRFEAQRASALQDLGPGERFPTLAASLAHFGVSDPLVREITTQMAQHGSLRIANLPDAIKKNGMSLIPGVREGEQVTRVSLQIKVLMPNPQSGIK